MRYEKHIFICCNQRPPEADRPSCAEAHGKEIKAAFKNLIKEHHLQNSVRAQTTSCFNLCEFGPNIVVYPEGVFYGNVQLSDVNEIFESHILNNKHVERLKLDV